MVRLQGSCLQSTIEASPLMKIKLNPWVLKHRMSSTKTYLSNVKDEHDKTCEHWDTLFPELVVWVNKISASKCPASILELTQWHEHEHDMTDTSLICNFENFQTVNAKTSTCITMHSFEKQRRDTWKIMSIKIRWKESFKLDHQMANQSAGKLDILGLLSIKRRMDSCQN